MNLAMAGALSGAGTGMIAEVQHQRDLEKMNLEEARETRMRSYEHEFQGQMQKSQQDFQSGQQEKLFGQQATLAEKTQERQEAVERQKTASAEKIGQGHDQARIDAANIRADAMSKSKTQKSRWKFTPVKSTDIIDGVPAEKTTINVSDQASGQTFQQFGDKFVPQGVDPKSVKTLPDQQKQQAAEDYLLKNPDFVDFFLKKFNYLPAKFLAAQRAQMTTSQSTRSTSGADDSDDEEE